MSLSGLYYYVASEILTRGAWYVMPVWTMYNVYRVSEAAYQTISQTSYVVGRTYGVACWVLGSRAPTREEIRVIMVSDDDDFVVIS